MGGENTMRQSVLSFSFSHYLIDRDRTQEYDRKAQQADHSSQLVTASNRAEAEGHKVSSVADNSQTQIEGKMEAAIQQRRARGVAPTLKRRGATASEPQPTQDQNQWQQQPQPQPDQDQPQPQQAPPDQNQPKQSPPQ